MKAGKDNSGESRRRVQCSRRRAPEKREIHADPRFGDVIVTKFINYCMKDGKRSVSEKAFYSALDIIKDKSGQDGIEIFRTALNNVKPTVEVKSRRIGGATYQVPVEVRAERRTQLAMRWLIGFARSRPRKHLCRAAGCGAHDGEQKRRTVYQEARRHPSNG